MFLGRAILLFQAKTKGTPILAIEFSKLATPKISETNENSRHGVKEWSSFYFFPSGWVVGRGGGLI